MRTIVGRLKKAMMKQTDGERASTLDKRKTHRPVEMDGPSSSSATSSSRVNLLQMPFDNCWSSQRGFQYSSTRMQPKHRRMATFREDFGPPISSSSSFSSSNDASYPYPSPNKFPKTNPFFKLAGNEARHLKCIANSNNYRERSANPSLVHYPIVEESETTTTDSAFTTSQSTSVSSDSRESTSRCNQNIQMRKIIAGLKAFGIKGELYVSMIVNRTMLTISVEEARNLQPPPDCLNCNAYIRLSLMPDEEKRTQYKSELVPGSTSPMFNLNVSFELLPEDVGKRMLISVWNRDPKAPKGTLLGCMAFTIRSLMQTKHVEGWYYLLAPHYGRQKHLAVDKVNMLTYYGSVDSLQHQQQLCGRSTTGPVFI